ncbi:unnamed protein product, partial [marine sediment metagenome]
VCIIGLGYVGLPLAEAFSKSLKVIGFDIEKDKISSLNKLNESRETNSAVLTNLTFTSDPKCIGKADFIIIAVPTP